MIRVVVGPLAERTEEAILRPIRSDLAPVTAAAREVEAAAGASLVERLEHGGEMPIGGAVITPAGQLAASFVIHAVVSSVDEPATAHSVRRAVENGLRRAADLGIESVALPPLGIMVGTVEAEDAARHLLDILREHIEEGHPPTDFVVVVPGAYEEAIFSALL